MTQKELDKLESHINKWLKANGQRQSDQYTKLVMLAIGDYYKKPKRSTAFKKPTVEEIAEYAVEINFNSLDPEQFFDFYESKNWMVGKSKMNNWKAAVRTWKRSRGEDSQSENDEWSKVR